MFKRLGEKIDKVLKFSKESFKSSTLKGTDTKVEYGVEGAEATTTGDGGNVALGDGEHELSNGEKITVKDGLVTKIENAPEEAPVEMEEEKDVKTEEVIDEPLEISIEEIIEDVEKVDEELSSVDNKDSKIAELEGKIAELEKQLEGKFSTLPTKGDLEAFKKEFLNQLKTTPAQFSEVKVEEEPTNKWLAMARLKNKNK